MVSNIWSPLPPPPTHCPLFRSEGGLDFFLESSLSLRGVTNNRTLQQVPPPPLFLPCVLYRYSKAGSPFNACFSRARKPTKPQVFFSLSENCAKKLIALWGGGGGRRENKHCEKSPFSPASSHCRAAAAAAAAILSLPSTVYRHSGFLKFLNRRRA